MTGVQTCALPIYFDEKTNTFTPKEKEQLENAMNKRAEELMKEVKELIGKK